ncbi:MAG: 1,4-alpha-glucan branching protein GlgB, partial [Lachnospiraceae bacterium]
VEGDIYKYEIKCKNSMVMLKADPYGNYMEVRPGTASVVYDLDGFKWDDNEWVKQFKAQDHDKVPMSIYELHLGSFKKDGEGFLNYRQLAREVIDYVKDMGYTHVELMPILEHPLDASWGYQVMGYYAPTSRYGSPKDFMFFVNALHDAGIGVILDWVPAHFPRDISGLAGFDGTCLYEHYDPRQGSHPDWGTLIFNYGRPQVSNFLIANALYWAKYYHIDGIRTDAVASMLYLDYGKQPGQWVPNIYGGKENLESIEMLKHMNSIFKKQGLHTMLIAEESTAWPKVTGKVNEDGLGFDYKWNMGWMNDFINFMKWDPIYRKSHYGELTFSMLYNYSEKFILVLSHDEVVHGKGSMIAKMPGDTHELKFANLRVAYGYMFTHPGKKLLFMGQDFAQFDEWNENEEIQWNLLQYDEHRHMKEYVAALNRLYTSEKALYELDYDTEGFEWINCSSADETILVFLRKSKDGSVLLVTANFTPVVRNKYKVGVPFAGKYKEIFNSDDVKFGGEGNTNPRVKTSDESECDGRDNSIRLTVPPLGISVMRYIPYTEEELKAIEDAKKAKLEKARKAAAAKAKAKEVAAAKKAKAKESAQKTAKTATEKKTDTNTKSKVAVKSKLKILNKE